MSLKNWFDIQDVVIAQGEVARALLARLVDGNGVVKMASWGNLEAALTASRLRLERAEALNGGTHAFFWRFDLRLLCRIKTRGSVRRKTPHMTLSSSAGLDWNQELGKYDRRGALVRRGDSNGQLRQLLAPKLRREAEHTGMLRDHRAYARSRWGFDPVETSEIWADACHFNFPPGFDFSPIEGAGTSGR